MDSRIYADEAPVDAVVIVRRPAHCGRSNEDLECLGCGYKLGVIGRRRRNGEPEYCPGETRKTAAG